MRGLKPEIIPELVRRDVELVKKEAVFLLEFRDDYEIDIRIQKEGRLNILAVIGPVQRHAIIDKNICKYFPDEAVLLEIGLRRGRPYHECMNTKRRIGEFTCFPYRRKWFQMSESQFLKTAPIIFELLQKYTNEITFNWKDSYIPGPRNFWSYRKKKLFCNTIYRLAKKRIRFSVYKKDEELLKFVYWVELNLNNDLANHLIGLAKFIDKRLKPYRENGYKKRFMDLGGAKQIKKIIDGKFLQPYLLEEMVLKYLPNSNENLLINEIRELVDWNWDGAMERKLAQRAVIPSSINEISLRVIRGLETQKDYIVFGLESNLVLHDVLPNGNCPF